MVQYKIFNVVASSYVTDGINLHELIYYLPEARYDPSGFRAIVITQDNPKSAQLIFEDGRVVSTGARSINSAERSISNVGVMLEEAGVPVYDKLYIEIENIVARASIEKKLDLHYLAQVMDDVEFNPEEFPGIIKKEIFKKEDDEEYEVSTLIFSSGKIVITGHKSVEELKESFENIVHEIENKMSELKE